jgi:hypothetical protein
VASSCRDSSIFVATPPDLAAECSGPNDYADLRCVTVDPVVAGSIPVGLADSYLPHWLVGPLGPVLSQLVRYFVAFWV